MRYGRGLMVLGFCLVLTGFQVRAEDSKAPAAQSPSWSAKMKDLKTTLLDLMPYMHSEKAYLEKDNDSKIRDLLSKLNKLTHSIEKPKDAFDGDPTLPLVAGLLKGELNRVESEFKRGRKSYSRSVLRTIPGYCVACHSRGSGPDFSALKDFNPPENLSRLERGEAYASVRNFDRALGEFQAVVSDETAAQVTPFDWERAARLSILLLVRVKNEPARALEVVERMIRTESSPEYLRSDAVEWKKSLNTWIKESKKRFSTEEGYYVELKRLLAQAQSMQKYPADRVGEIAYLRLSSMTHEMLRKYPRGKHFADGMLMLGMSYEALRNLDLWSYHEVLYEGCIHSDPHSATARACYSKLEESVFIGFSGSAGLSIPSDVKDRLGELKRLSQPESVKVKP